MLCQEGLEWVLEWAGAAEVAVDKAGARAEGRAREEWVVALPPGRAASVPAQSAARRRRTQPDSLACKWCALSVAGP